MRNHIRTKLAEINYRIATDEGTNVELLEDEQEEIMAELTASEMPIQYKQQVEDLKKALTSETLTDKNAAEFVKMLQALGTE